MKRLAEWALTPFFLLAFGLVLGGFDLAGRLVRPFSLRAFEWVMGGLQWALMTVFRLFGTRLEVERSPAIRRHTGYVVVSNHQSLFDIALIGGLLFSNLPKYVAKAELARWIPAVSLNLRWGGHALIDRSDASQAMAAITALGQAAQERRFSAVIFPEGTRSREGDLGNFKRAGGRALLAAADKLAVIPAAIDGSWRLNQLLPLRLGSRVRIAFGDPIARSPDDTAATLASCRTWIEGTLSRWRAP